MIDINEEEIYIHNTIQVTYTEIEHVTPTMPAIYTMLQTVNRSDLRHI